MGEAPAGSTDLALDATTRRALPVIFLGVGVMYLFIAMASPVLSEERLPASLLVRWYATAALGLVGAVVLWKRPAPVGWGNAIAGVLGAVVVLNSLLVIDVAGPEFLFALVVALVAFGLFLLSIPWVVGLCLLGLGGWAYLAQDAGWGPQWSPRLVNLVGFCVVAVVAQAMRVGLHRRLESLKTKEAQRVAQEHELARQKALAEQRRRIVRMTSHELATPMTPVLLQANVLARGDLSPKQRKNLEVLQRNLDRLKGTIDKVLAAAKADEAAEFYDQLDD